MGTTAQKINYAINATNDIAEGINNIGGDITQNTELADFKKELDKIYNELPKATGEGTSIILQNTRKGKVLLTPKGNVEQETTEGYNLLPYRNTTQTRNGLTFTNHGDGTFSINGTASAQTIYCINAESQLSTILNMKLESTSYRVNVGQAMSGSTFFVQLAYKKPDGTTGYASVATDGGTINNLTIQDINNNAGFGLIIREGTSFDNVLIKPMLQLATTSYDFEPYTGGIASPNPDYPQDIKVVTGKNKVVYKGINSIDTRNFPDVSKIGITIKNEKGYPVVNGTTTEAGSYYRTLEEFTLKPGKYTFFVPKHSTTGVGVTVSLGYNNTAISNFQINNKDNNLKIITVEEELAVNQLRMWFESGKNFENYEMKIMLLEGEYTEETIPDYEPYIEPIEKELKLTSKNIFSYMGSRTTTTNGVTCKFENGILTFTGVASAPTIFNLTDLIDFNYINKFIKNNKFTTSLAITGTSSKAVELNFGSASNNYTYQIKTNVSSQLYNYSLDMTKMQIYVPNETSFSNFVIKIQIEISESATSYEQYYKYELAKIQDNSDLIFKNEIANPYYDSNLIENAWYKKEKIGKRILNGSETWGTSNNVFYTSDISDYSRENNVPYSSLFAGESNKSSTGVAFGNNACAFNNSYDYNRFYIKSRKITSISSFLQENKPVLYYLKDTANISYKQITETTLINQLEEINSIIGKGGTVVIETESEEENAQLIVNASALASFENS